MRVSKVLLATWPVFYRTVFNATEQKLLGFQRLEAGWHYSEGIKITKLAVDEAVDLHRAIVSQGFDETDAFPGLDGEIQITVYKGEDYFEFEREASGAWTIIHERRDEEIECKSKLNLADASEYARLLRSKLCIVFESSQDFTGIRVRTDSKVWPLNLRNRMGPFQLSAETVS